MKLRYSFFSKNWLYSCLIIVFIFAFSLRLQGQNAPSKQWDKTFGGTENDDFTCLQQTCDGGYILGGFSKSGISVDKSQASKGKTDYWVIKLDANGNKQWDKTIGGSDDDELYSLQQTSDGGYILGGWSYSHISGDKSQYANGSDYWIVKLDASGNKIWDKSFGGLHYDWFYVLQQTSDGGYILGGWSESNIGRDKSQDRRGYRDFWVIKLDVNGNKSWDKTLGGSDDERLYSLQQTSDGGYILGGYSGSPISGEKTQANKGYLDYWVVKIDGNGNKLWDKTLGGSGRDEILSLQQTSDGGYILGGFSFSGISSDKSQDNKGRAFSYTSDYWIIKLDANGNKTWDKTIGGDSFDYLYSLKQTSDGGYILGGYSESNLSGDKSQDNNFSHDYWIVKLDGSGNKLWDKTIGGRYEEYFYALQQTSDEGYILGGRSYSGISFDKSEASKGGLDFWLVKLEGSHVVSTPTLTTSCNNGNTTVNLNLKGIQPGYWTLTYTVNGVVQTASGTTPTFTLEQNATLGSVFSLVSIVSGTCKTNLTYSLTIQPIPASPVVTTGSNICNGSVTLSATGAPAGGGYVWYDVASGGKPLYNSPSGTFTTPEINTTTTYYVAASNNGGCEGSRTPVTSTIITCPTPFIPNIITLNRDGKNDTFKPQNLPEGKWLLQIYNRWGIQLFESEDYQDNWPNSNITDGTYYYLLKNPKSGQQFKGWVEVVH